MAAGSDTFWRLLPDVRADERSRFLFFAALLTLVSLAQTLGLAGTEALFLAEFGAGKLPQTFIAASLFTVLGSIAYALRVGEARNDRLFVQMLVGSGALLAAATFGVLEGRSWLLPGLLIPVMLEIFELRGICRFSILASLLVLYGGFMLRYLTVELGQVSTWTEYAVQFDPQLLLRLTQ